MISPLYTIEYVLHGKPTSFVIRADKMNDAQAWHWASCDAGCGHIPRSSRDQTKKTSMQAAQQYGISQVQWRAVSLNPA